MQPQSAMAMTYADDVTPAEAWRALKNDKAAQLVDVRTVPEWSFVGVPDVSALGKPVIMLSWRTYPTMNIVSDFCKKLSAEVPDKDAPLYFICRSGVRSAEAAEAMTERGYTNCYNIIGGFEGQPNSDGQRGEASGWKASGLAWNQS